MFNGDSRQTITELVVESCKSVVELADSIKDFTANPPNIGVWVWAFSTT